MSWIGGLVSGVGELLGSGINALNQNNVNKKNYEMQKEFAQNGLSWKVEDAKRAGIHPLVALGAQTYQATPSYAGASSGIGEASKQFGQGISKALSLQSEKDKLEIERMRLENEKLSKEINDDTNQNIFGAVSKSDNQNLSVTNDVSSPSGSLPLKKVVKVGQDLMLLGTGNDSFEFSFDPESLKGQQVSEGALQSIFNFGELRTRLNRKYPLIHKIEKQMREAGLLRKDEMLEPTYYGTGIRLSKVKKPVPVKQFKLKDINSSFKAHHQSWKNKQ